MNSDNKTDIPCLFDTGTGFSVSYRDSLLYSRTDPQKRTCSVISRFEFEEKTLYIVPSPVLFYGIPELISRLPESSALVCIEADRTLYEFSLPHVPDNNRISYFFAENLSAFLEAFDGVELPSYRKIRQIILGNGYSVCKTLYKSLLMLLDERLSTYWKNKMTMIYMSRMWINNIFLNLAACASSHFTGNFRTEKPVLVIGAGESLEDGLAEIGKHRSGLFLLCVDTALPVLNQSGIVPDAVVAVEAQHANLYDFFGSGGTESICLFYDLNSHFRIHSVFCGNKMPFLSEFRDIRLFAELEEHSLMPVRVPPLGSVGLTALHLASKITDRVCGYIGLDFSYRPGKPHAKGTESHKRLLSGLNRLSSADYSISGFRRNSRQYEGLEKTFHSDPVLSYYAKQCAWLLKKGNYADCGSNNFVENKFKLSIAGLASSSSECKTPVSAEQGESGSPPSGDKVRKFLAGKKDDLENLREMIIASGFMMTEKIRFQLMDNDFIYADFPEQDLLSLDSRITMSRIFTSACRYIDTLEKALAITLQNTQEG